MEHSAEKAGWTANTLAIHYESLRMADCRFDDERELRHHEVGEERDRRYTETNIEREKALKIKETADLAALSLAREIQDYKDEKANLLREQISSERGLYASKDDLIGAMKEISATVRPLADYISADRGRMNGIGQSWGVLLGVSTVAAALATVVTKLVS